VNNIIEIHEGMIEVESSVGQGATFAFVFPLVAKEKRKD
jgi:signal transduction histidine kinase